MATIGHRSSVFIVLAILLAACGQAGAVPDPSASPTPSARPDPTSSPRPSAPPSPTEAPTPSPDPSGDPVPPPTGSPIAYGWGDVLSVTVDGLAVRRYPDATGPFVTGMTFDLDSQTYRLTSRELRLDTGHIVFVNLGPIVRDGIAWYRVHTADQGVGWDADGDGEVGDSGWIAGGTVDAAYVKPALGFPVDSEPLITDLLSISGTGDATSSVFRASTQVGGSYALATEDTAPCLFHVTLQPTGETLIDTGLEAVYDGGDFATSGALAPGEYTIQVEAGVPGQPEAACPWSLVLLPAQG